MKCILNGVLTDVASAAIPVGDLSIRRGYGIFDFFRVHDNRPLYLEDHLTRLFNGISQLRLDVSISKSDLRDQIVALIRTNNVNGITGIRIVVTGGLSPDGFTPSASNIIITQENFNPPAAGLYETGTSIITSEYRRELAHVKSLNYMNAIYHAPDMKRAGATEILYHWKGIVSECTRSNIFCIHGNTLYTPVSDALEGVTRKNVIRLAAAEMDVREEDFTLEFLRSADEVFITSTIKRILPVSLIDGIPAGGGRRGEVTKRLIELLDESDEQ